VSDRRLKSTQSKSLPEMTLEEVALVAGPYCGMTYQLDVEERCLTIDIPVQIGPGSIHMAHEGQEWHRYERIGLFDTLFYYMFDFVE
jgi:hypothetical protein